MPGELLKDRVVVRQQSEANRIHNKGHYGRPLSGGALELTLHEAAYLAEVERLEVHRNGTALDWSALVVEATRIEPGFEVLYLAYRDLRERGYLVHAAVGSPGAHFHVWPRGTERPGRPAAWVRAVSERGHLVLTELAAFARAATEVGAVPRLVVVDEESDLTFYDLSADPPNGRVPARTEAAAQGVFLADRVLVPNAADSPLHAREFFGKPVATGLQLSVVEAAFLVEAGQLTLQDVQGRPLGLGPLLRRARDVEPQLDLRLRVFRDLKGRGLIVKTGFKFGTHFRAYEDRPEEGHAPYLVQAVPPDFESPWEPVARAIRLSHSVRKKFYLAAVGSQEVAYLAFGRFRP